MHNRILSTDKWNDLNDKEKSLLFNAALSDIQKGDLYGKRTLRKYIKGFHGMRDFFEKREEYEKCHIVKTLIDKL